MSEKTKINSQVIIESVAAVEKASHDGKISSFANKTLYQIVGSLSGEDNVITISEVEHYYHLGSTDSYKAYQSFYDLYGTPIPFYAKWEDAQAHQRWNVYQRRFEIWKEVQTSVFQNMGLEENQLGTITKISPSNLPKSTSNTPSRNTNQEVEVPREVQERVRNDLMASVEDENQTFYEDICLNEYPRLPDEIKSQCEDLESRSGDLDPLPKE